MNILMLNYEFPPIGGGASPVSYDIGKGLVEKGHKVTVVTMAFQDLPKYEVMDGMEVYRVKCWRTEKMVCHPWEQATYILAAMRFIKRYLDIKEYDICLNHFIIPTGVVAWRLKRKYKIPYVITSHGSDVIGHNNKRFKLLYSIVKAPWKMIARNAAVIISPSKYLKELILQTEPNAVVEIIRNGVDMDFYTRTADKRKSMLVMCRLQETKNVQYILNALSAINMNGWELNILGEGPYKESLQRIVDNNHLKDKVFFRGWVTNKSDEHLKYIQEASIYLSASKVENCPTSILEVLSCGANILLSDIPAHRQLVQEIDDSVFFSNENVDELVTKLQTLIIKLENSNELSNQYCLDDYEWSKSINKYEQCLFDSAKKE